MKVSLRKANALQEQLNEAIKTRPNVDFLKSMLLTTNCGGLRLKMQTKYYKEVERKLDMVEAGFLFVSE